MLKLKPGNVIAAGPETACAVPDPNNDPGVPETSAYAATLRWPEPDTTYTVMLVTVPEPLV